MRVYSCAQMEGRRSVNAIVSALTAFRVHDQVGSKTAVDACFAVGSHQSCRGGRVLTGLANFAPLVVGVLSEAQLLLQGVSCARPQLSMQSVPRLSMC